MHQTRRASGMMPFIWQTMTSSHLQLKQMILMAAMSISRHQKRNYFCSITDCLILLSRGCNLWCEPRSGWEITIQQSHFTKDHSYHAKKSAPHHVHLLGYDVLFVLRPRLQLALLGLTTNHMTPHLKHDYRSYSSGSIESARGNLNMATLSEVTAFLLTTIYQQYLAI